MGQLYYSVSLCLCLCTNVLWLKSRSYSFKNWRSVHHLKATFHLILYYKFIGLLATPNNNISLVTCCLRMTDGYTVFWSYCVHHNIYHSTFKYINTEDMGKQGPAVPCHIELQQSWLCSFDFGVIGLEYMVQNKVNTWTPLFLHILCIDIT